MNKGPLTTSFIIKSASSPAHRIRKLEGEIVKGAS